MRSIYGTIDEPGSAHILILRGIREGLSYYNYHFKKYPNWGCILAPECGELYADLLSGISEMPLDGIHYIYTSGVLLSDEGLITEVLRRHPPYMEEDDPLVEEPMRKWEIPKPLSPEVTLEMPTGTPPGAESIIYTPHRDPHYTPLRFEYSEVVPPHSAIDPTERMKLSLVHRLCLYPELFVIERLETPMGTKVKITLEVLKRD